MSSVCSPHTFRVTPQFLSSRPKRQGLPSPSKWRTAQGLPSPSKWRTAQGLPSPSKWRTAHDVPRSARASFLINTVPKYKIGVFLMNASSLFVQLVQRFHNYEVAAVLWVLLKEEADVKEYGMTAGKMADEQLCQTISESTVRRAIDRLAGAGFISVRVHKNTKTLVSVNRDAVLELLRKRLPERLPAVSKKEFDFLDAWKADGTN